MTGSAMLTTWSNPLGVTMGDPAGIGPEIVMRLVDELSRTDPAALDSLVILGDEATLRRAMAVCGLAPELWQAAIAMRFRQACTLPAPPCFGTISAEAGRAAYESLITGIDLCLAGQLCGLVTAPIHKEALHAAGVVEPGHTEILAERTGAAEFGMMLANDVLRVMLVSIHVSLRDAIAAVTREAVERAIRLAAEGARAFGIRNPRIGVAGLNPHAGEGGLFGREEIEIVSPAIETMRAAGFDAAGPFAPDTVFMRARQGAFDAVVAMYHDQGLIPVKYLGIDHGVNITIGLPFIRTSVDHGTAFDLAGTGKASHASLAYALKTARSMAAARISSSVSA
jgi:4-hydroxythreonine-4-phosphate dehydrogenase